MNVAEKYGLLSPSSVTEEINGRKWTFFMCSVATCARLAPVLSRLAGHVSTLLTPNNKDQGGTEETYVEGGTTVSKTEYHPINPDLARLRTAQREKAVQGAISELLDGKNCAAIGRLLMDSLRDDFPRSETRTDEQCAHFVESMDAPILVQFLRGLMRANGRMFGDLGKELGRVVRQKAAELLGEDGEAPSPDPQPVDG